MLPALTALNHRDYELLDALRVERFRAVFTHSLTNSNIFLSGLDRTMLISGGEEMTALLPHTKEIESEAWLIAAATTIQIYACNELIYKESTTYRDGWNKLGLMAKGESRMTAAIQDLETTQALDNDGSITDTFGSRPESTKIIKSLALTDIAADLETESEAIQEFLEERNATLIDFAGVIVVPESQAVIAYEHYSVIRARQKMQERFARHYAATEEKPQAKATKNTAPKESKPKKPTLTFKKQFKVNRSNYKRTVQNFLDAMFPDNEADQQKALSDILQPNEIGGAYLDKIVKAGGYNDKQHARDLLYKAAAELSKSSLGTEEEEGEPEAAAG